MNGPPIEAQAAEPAKKARVWTDEQKAQARETRARNKELKAKNSASPTGITRGEKASGRPERIPLDGTGPLVVPPQIVQEIKDRGCHARLCLDDGAGSIQRYISAWWEFYEDANGQQFRRPGGRGQDHVLMMLPEKLFQEDQALRREKRRGKLQRETALDHSGGVKEYVPGDASSALTRE
jgi:hypothetical protein